MREKDRKDGRKEYPRSEPKDDEPPGYCFIEAEAKPGDGESDYKRDRYQ
jgi:hypothetical protein